MDERELYHHGTKGMKWGQRLYQNKDGSLTALGRVRYGVGKAGKKIGAAAKSVGEKHKAKTAAKKEAKRIAALMKKPIRELSESELKERTKRATDERALKQIEGYNKQAAMTFFQKFGSKMLNEAAVPALVSVGKKYLEKAFTKATGLDAPDMTNTYDILKKLGGDVTKLTDAQAKALKERETNLNTAKQQIEQRERVGSGNDNNQGSQSSGKPKDNKNKDNSDRAENQQTKVDKSAATQTPKKNESNSSTSKPYVGKGITTDENGIPAYLQKDRSTRRARSANRYAGETVGNIPKSVVNQGRNVMDDDYWEVWLNTKLRHSIEESTDNGIV